MAALKKYLHFSQSQYQYEPKGFVRLQTAVESEQAHQWLIRFAVSDCGIGTPEDQCDKIFEPYCRYTPKKLLRTNELFVKLMKI